MAAQKISILAPRSSKYSTMSRRAYAGRPAQAAFPVSLPPVDRRVEQSRLPRKQFLHHVEFRMSVDDEILNEHSIDLRLLPRGLEPRRRIVSIDPLPI